MYYVKALTRHVHNSNNCVFRERIYKALACVCSDKLGIPVNGVHSNHGILPEFLQK